MTVAPVSFCFVSPQLIVGAPAPEIGKRRKSVEMEGLVARHLEGVTASIPTLMGRLARIAGARDPGTGLYRWPELDVLPRQGEVSERVRRIHQQILWQWLGESFSFRTADMVLWLASEGAQELAGKLLLAGKYDQLLPFRVPEYEREHFLMDVELVVTMAASRLEPAGIRPRHGKIA